MLFIFLLVFVHTAAPVSVTRDFSTTERAPFSAQAGIFSDEEIGPMFSMAPDTDFEEALSAMKSTRGFSGGSSILPEAKPPGFEPQPPGVEETPEYREMMRNGAYAESNTPAKIDYPATATVSYEGLPLNDNAIESFTSKDVTTEQEESSGEQKLTTIASHVDVEFSSLDSDGSGQIELNRGVEKVSGEVGQYSSYESPKTLSEVTPYGQQQTLTVPAYGDPSYDGYGQSAVSQSISTSPDTPYDLVPWSTTTSDSENDGFTHNEALTNVLHDTVPQTTVLPDTGYEGGGQSAPPPEARTSVGAQSTDSSTMQSYDGVAQVSNYDVVPSSSYDEAAQHITSYDLPFASAGENSMSTNSIPSTEIQKGQEQQNVFHDAVKEKSNNGQTVLNAPVAKETFGTKEAGKLEKYMEDVDKRSTKTSGKAAVIGPPADRAPPRRGAVEGCPEPVLCAKNCFVYINENGCQDCQCLWQALACDNDNDCPEEVQYCDLGKCNCRPGQRQDMARSGFCEPDPKFKGTFPQEDIGQFAKRTKRAATSQLDSLNKHAHLEVPTDTRTILPRVFQ
ncbi:hypothetical protein RB195_021124 [Necator americanus]|uniref:Uncharacterized protein n=1 Tax=Necator americanus TaxID=51031 RepID=A0ABR1EAN4_NECAM